MTEFLDSPLFGRVPESRLKPIEQFSGSMTDRALSPEDKWLVGFHIDVGKPFRLVFKPTPEYRDRYESIVVSGDAEVVQVQGVRKQGGKS